MKVTKQQGTLKFAPYSINIVVESQIDENNLIQAADMISDESDRECIIGLGVSILKAVRNR